MSAQHTLGPWKIYRVEAGENKGQILGIGDADGGGVTDAYGGLWRSGEELEANANLIAAAPDLLAAAEAALITLMPDQSDDFVWATISQLLCAIAKAKGEIA